MANEWSARQGGGGTGSGNLGPWKREGERKIKKKKKKDGCIVLVEGIKSGLGAVPKSAGFTPGVVPITSG